MRALALLAAVSLVGCQYPGSTVPSRIANLPVQADVVWETCGEVNGGWTPGVVHVCVEDLVVGRDFTRFVILHELGHEMAFDYGMLGQFDEGDESAADEYATVVAVAVGRGDIALAGAKGFEDMSAPWIPGDPHPPLVIRAAHIRCMVAGSFGSPECRAAWDHATSVWNKATGGK